MIWETKKLIVLLLITILFLAGTITENSTGSVSADVIATGQRTITQPSEEPATDLHFIVYQADKPEVYIIDWEIIISVPGSFRNQTPSDWPIGNNLIHSVEVDYDFSIPVNKGETVDIDALLRLNEWNTVKFADIYWTYEDSDPTSAMPADIGWTIPTVVGESRGGWTIAKFTTLDTNGNTIAVDLVGHQFEDSNPLPALTDMVISNGTPENSGDTEVFITGWGISNFEGMSEFPGWDFVENYTDWQVFRDDYISLPPGYEVNIEGRLIQWTPTPTQNPDPTPTPTLTPDPTPTPTPLPCSGTYELQAEDENWSSGSVESDHAGYTGTGYVNTDNAAGEWIEWSVELEDACNATCAFRYACAGDARPMDLSVNGSVVTNLDFLCPGAWDAWATETADVTLNLAAGSNTIRLTATGSSGGPNMDKMDLIINGGEDPTPAPYDCGDVNGDGVVDIVDALLIAQCYVGIAECPPLEIGDVNCDGVVDIVDALLIAQFYVGLLNILDCCEEPPEELRCGTMIGYKERLETDPAFAAREEQLDQAINEYIQNMQQNDITQFRSGIVIIPVVVHVVYKNTTENISDAQINSQIAVLNEDYRKLNADVTNVPAAFTSAVCDARIQFKLAERDPNCNPTTGITRTSTTVTSFDKDHLAITATGRNPVKFDSSGGKDGWPSDLYLNIWVCDLTAPLLGYASFPSDLSTRPSEDGVVIDYASFGDTGTAASPFDLGRTATHEIGHWLNLEHIWGNDHNEIDVCSGTDDVADTPNQDIYNLGCPTHPHASCGSDDMFMNYLDYVDDDCMIMFTNGQSDRMDAVLYTTRMDIVGSQGDVPPPGITEDLFSRDMDDDPGDEPNTTSTSMCKSDDIWVRNGSDGFVNQEHQNPIGDATNYVYVRIRNRGCGTASSGDVNVYWAKTGTGLGWPAPWDGSVVTPALMGNYIGSQPTGSISGSDHTILEFVWNTPDPADYAMFGAQNTHFCLLSRIETSTTSPYGMTFPETNNLSDNVQNNNNIVWKNVTVSEPETGGRFASMIVSNYTANTGIYRITFKNDERELPIFEFGNVKAKLDDDLYNLWDSGGMQGEGIEYLGDGTIQILKDGAYIDNITLTNNQLAVMDVIFDADTGRMQYNRNIFKLHIIQSYSSSDQFVGSVIVLFRYGN